MLLDCVLTATNDNPMYCDFIPIFVKTWRKLLPNVLIKIIFCGEEIPEKFKEYEEYLILFKPHSWVSTAFTAQYIRLLYPALIDVDEGVLITDIDMIPMNSNYYTKNIESVSEDKFFCYRDVLHTECAQIPMCYNIALPEVWSNIFDIETLEDVEQRIVEIHDKIEYEDRHAGKGWGTDQNHLFLSVMAYQNQNNKNIFEYKNDLITKYKRLDRDDGNSRSLPASVVDDIKNHKYSDYHLNRPMSKFNDINWKIYNLL